MLPKYTISELYARSPDTMTGDYIIDSLLTLLKNHTGMKSHTGMKTPAGMKAKEVAKALGVRKSDLSGAVRILTGKTLDAMLTEWYMLKALELLSRTSLDFATIAQLCGFRHRKYLAQAMKRYLKMTPFQYRNGYLRGVQRPCQKPRNIKC